MSIDEQHLPKLNKQSSQHPVSFCETNQGDNIPSFLLKTFQILQNSKFQDIISWTRSGQGFIVKKVKQFSETILPVYFRHNNYTSFVRQLNMYDFHKTRQENQENAFKNFLFKKGHKYLLKEIQRKDYKKNKETNKELYSILEKQKYNPSMADLSDCGQPYSRVKEDTIMSSPQNECFRANITELKKVKNELEEKSLKLMAFRETELTTEMLMKAIDVLFECEYAAKKAFTQVQILKTDYELNERKNYISTLREAPVQDDRKPELYTAQRIQTKHSLSGFKQPLTDAKTILFPSAQQKISGFSGFQKFETTQACLFNSFRTC